MRTALIVLTVATAVGVGTATAQAGTQPVPHPVGATDVSGSTGLLLPHGCTTTFAGQAGRTPVRPTTGGVTAYLHEQGANALGYYRCAV